jgi:excisionase family DNA binding protein
VNSDSQLALALVEGLDSRALELLAERLAPLLAGGPAPDSGPVAFTVATLAVELGLSERAVRAAIKRGELQAAKRGRSYVIARAAVEAWAGGERGGLQVGDAAPAAALRARERAPRGRAHRSVRGAALARLDGER